MITAETIRQRWMPRIEGQRLTDLLRWATHVALLRHQKRQRGMRLTKAGAVEGCATSRSRPSAPTASSTSSMD